MKIAALVFTLAITAVGIVHVIDLIRFEWGANKAIPLRDIFWILAITAIGVMASISIFKYVP